MSSENNAPQAQVDVHADVNVEAKTNTDKVDVHADVNVEAKTNTDKVDVHADAGLQINIPSVSIEDLLSAGVHYGHKTNRWNPGMKQYIYGQRSGIHIIDVRKTLSKMMQAMLVIYKAIADGKKILFVCTKENLSPIVKNLAEQTNQFHITHKWRSGTLTNWIVIRLATRKIPKLQKELQNPTGYKKKQLVSMQKTLNKLEQSFGGMHGLVGRPDLIVVFHKQDYAAVTEAASLGIPVVAITDTNVNPNLVTYPIPGNDDSPRSVELFSQLMLQTINNATAANPSKAKKPA